MCTQDGINDLTNQFVEAVADNTYEKVFIYIS